MIVPLEKRTISSYRLSIVTSCTHCIATISHDVYGQSGGGGRYRGPPGPYLDLSLGLHASVSPAGAAVKRQQRKTATWRQRCASFYFFCYRTMRPLRRQKCGVRGKIVSSGPIEVGISDISRHNLASGPTCIPVDTLYHCKTLGEFSHRSWIETLQNWNWLGRQSVHQSID